MKRRYAVIGLALVIGFSTISPALGGPSPAATVAGGVKSLAKKALGKSKKATKRSRKAKRKAAQAKRLAKETAGLIAEIDADSVILEGPPGPKGDQGEKGDPGEDATNLFAYIKDPGDTDDAAVVYGNGVTGVAELPSAGHYEVTFNRSLANCVVQVTPGFGLPFGEGPGSSQTAAASVEMRAGDDEDVRVFFYTPIFSKAVDTSFLISAFC